MRFAPTLHATQGRTPIFEAYCASSLDQPWLWLLCGFVTEALAVQDCRNLEPSGIVVLHQADVGEYLRSEDDL